VECAEIKQWLSLSRGFEAMRKDGNAGRYSCSLVRLVLVDPVLDPFTDLHRQFARQISLTLRRQPVVVAGARIALSARGVELGNEPFSGSIENSRASIVR